MCQALFWALGTRNKWGGGGKNTFIHGACILVECLILSSWSLGFRNQQIKPLPSPLHPGELTSAAGVEKALSQDASMDA